MNHAIEIRNLRKEYPTFQLKDISFDVPNGYITGFIGPNGSGKTTTIKSILNLIHYQSGEIRVLGKDNRTDFERLAPEIGVVMDNPMLVVDWTVANVERAISPFYPNWDKNKYAQLLQSFRIDKNKKVKELSRGMKVKLSVAIALSHDAKLLILDEPTSGLDPSARDELCEMLADFVMDETHSILFSTHITSDLEKIADYIVFLLKGEIIFQGPKDELSTRYVLVKGGLEDRNAINGLRHYGLRTHGTGFETMVERNELVALPEGIITEELSLDEIIVFMNREANHE